MLHDVHNVAAGLVEDETVSSADLSDDEDMIIPVHAKTISGVRLFLSHSVHSGHQ